jgi:glutamate-1-semialdehyde 2,1-aminomutase
MEAGLEAITLTEEEGFYEELENKAASLCDPLEDFIRQKGINASLQRVGSMFTLFLGKKSIGNMEEALTLDQGLFKKFFLHMLSRGILIPPSPFEAWFLSPSHTPYQLEKVSEAIKEFVNAN